MTKLTLEERETIIRFDDSDDKASFYTCNPTWIRKLDKMMSETPLLIKENEDQYSKTYIFPKKWLRVLKPRQLKEDEKQKLRDRAFAMRAKKQTRRENQTNNK